MRLSEFIKYSVHEVMGGILGAETDTHKFGIENDEERGIEFDVAVTANSEVEGQAGISVLDVGAKAKGNISESSTHRIKFTVKPRGKRNPPSA